MPARLWTPEDSPAYAALAELVQTMSPERLAAFASTLDREDLALLEQIVADALGTTWRATPDAMAEHLTQGEFTRWRYVRYLGEKFRQAADGESTRQIWNLPARYGKSLLGSQWGPVWVLDRTSGRAKVILVSYGYELAMENAVQVRDLLVEHSEVLRAQLRPDRRRKDRFVTDAGGGVLAAGIDGAITGFGVGAGGGLIVDDPFKNWQEAHSEARRAHVVNQFKGTLRNRLDDEAAFIIVIHHRVHPEDLTGQLLADTLNETGDVWDHVALPALAVADDPIGRAIGEPLEPGRFPLEAVRARAKGMGSYLASGLEQQDPSPEEGTELLRAWFQIEETRPVAPDDALTSWDLKLKDREEGDYVVGQAWWRVAGGFWCMDQIRGGFDHATTANAIALLAVRHPEIRRHIVEAAGSADEVLPKLRQADPDYEIDDAMASRLGMNEIERAQVQEIRRHGMSGIIPHPPKGDKRARAREWIAPVAEAKDVHVPADVEWLAAWIDEMAAFPNGANDDQVDAASQALQRLSKAPGVVTVPARQIPRVSPVGARRTPRRPGGFR